MDSKTLVNLSFIAGFASIALTNAAATLMIDLFPDQSSSITACVGELTNELKEVLIAFHLEQSFKVCFDWHAGVGPRSNYKRYWNWMDLCFTWRFVYPASTISMRGYDNWTAMSHKTTTCERPGIGSGCIIVEELVHR